MPVTEYEEQPDDDEKNNLKDDESKGENIMQEYLKDNAGKEMCGACNC